MDTIALAQPNARTRDLLPGRISLMRITVEANIRRPSRRKTAVLALALVVLVPGVAFASHIFNDVPNTSQYHASIGAIAEAGITVGCGSGNFCPTSNITREQEATFLHRGLGRVGMTYIDSPIGVGGTVDVKDIASVTIFVPGSTGLGVGANQFVKVDGVATIYGNGATSGCTCNMVMTLVDEDTDNVVGNQFDEVAAVVGAQMSLSTSYVFPEVPGEHTYTLRLNITASADFNVNWRTLIATTYTFGPGGTDDLFLLTPTAPKLHTSTDAAAAK